MNIDKKAYLNIDKYESTKHFHGLIHQHDFYTDIYPYDMKCGSYVAYKIQSDIYFDRTCEKNYIKRQNNMMFLNNINGGK